MKRIISISMFAILCASLVVPSCKKDSPIPVVKTLTFYSTKDASIFNGTSYYNGVKGEGSGVDGNYIDHGSGGSDVLRVGYSDANFYFVRTLVSFDVSSIPQNIKILDATLSLTMAKSGNKAPAVYVYKVTQSWVEGTTREPASDKCTWSDTFCSQPGAAIGDGSDVSWSSANFNTTLWTTNGGSFIDTPSDSVSNGGSAVFSSQGLIDDVKSWMVTPTNNFGWILKVNETALTGSGGETLRYFSKEAAANGAPVDTKPKLVITYQQ